MPIYSAFSLFFCLLCFQNENSHSLYAYVCANNTMKKIRAAGLRAKSWQMGDGGNMLLHPRPATNPTERRDTQVSTSRELTLPTLTHPHPVDSCLAWWVDSTWTPSNHMVCQLPRRLLHTAQPVTACTGRASVHRSLHRCPPPALQQDETWERKQLVPGQHTSLLTACVDAGGTTPPPPAAPQFPFAAAASRTKRSQQIIPQQLVTTAFAGEVLKMKARIHDNINTASSQLLCLTHGGEILWQGGFSCKNRAYLIPTPICEEHWQMLPCLGITWRVWNIWFKAEICSNTDTMDISVNIQWIQWKNHFYVWMFWLSNGVSLVNDLIWL